MAKATGITIILVGHVTKDGALAGPRVMEHIVDTVLYFEGDTHSSFRLVRAIKNRFGAVNEIGVFAMTEKGLKGVSNPSAIFLSTHGEPVPGSCVLVTLEGTRPMLVEVQALVDAGGPSPRRLSVGLERDRLAMMLAVLHRHAGIAALDQDVFVNAVGGVRISEPAADLAVMLAIQSSLRGKPLPRGFIAFGEVGLAGEVRPAPRGQERLREAAKLGFSIAIVPKANAPKGAAAKAFEGLTIHAGRAHRGSDRPRPHACEPAVNARLGWLLAALFAFAAWRAYDLAGLAFAASAIVFWLLLQFNRAVRVMKNAADSPVGHVASAVMFHAGLAPGMTMLQIVTKTKSLGRKVEGGDDDWRWSDDGGASVVLHFERGRLVRWQIERAPEPNGAAADPAA